MRIHQAQIAAAIACASVGVTLARIDEGARDPRDEPIEPDKEAVERARAARAAFVAAKQPKVHEHKREIARRLRQQAARDAKRKGRS